jgi:outer membrane protein OmpA-like peptidoglycan-associated protein
MTGNNWSRAAMAALVLATAGVSACSTRQKTGAAVGGVGGAVVGAGVGAAAGGKKGALVGAGVGAAAGATGGALIGRYMDKQEAELRREVDNARIVREGDQLTVQFDSEILFDTGRADLHTSARDDLQQFAEILKKYDQTNLVVEGHTDSTGSRAINEKLSLQRADTVVEYLGLRGVEKARLTPRGYAYDQPVASNATSEGRQKNRRVEIEIAPSPELRKQAAEEAQGPRASR